MYSELSIATVPHTLGSNIYQNVPLLQIAECLITSALDSIFQLASRDNNQCHVNDRLLNLYNLFICVWDYSRLDFLEIALV